jgi:hypothetical protein
LRIVETAICRVIAGTARLLAQWAKPCFTPTEPASEPMFTIHVDQIPSPTIARTPRHRIARTAYWAAYWPLPSRR